MPIITLDFNVRNKYALPQESIVAGGYALSMYSALIHEKPLAYGDIDVFVSLLRWEDIPISENREHYITSTFRIKSETRNGTKFQYVGVKDWDGDPYTLIKRFDLILSMIAIDGHRLIFPPQFELDFKNGIIHVVAGNLSNSSPKRVDKYKDRTSFALAEDPYVRPVIDPEEEAFGIISYEENPREIDWRSYEYPRARSNRM